jgi:hypothetical protein
LFSDILTKAYIIEEEIITLTVNLSLLYKFEYQ